MNNKHEMRKAAVKRLKRHINCPSYHHTVVKAIIGDDYDELTGNECIEYIINLLTDDDMDGYVRLPVDANGEVIHIGDELQWDDGERLTVIGVCNDIVFYVNDDSLGGAQWTKANNKRHYHKPTVEDVLRELVIACEDAGNAGPAVEALISKHAERLQLKEEE